ncbi:hypothetical protein SERLA73DRAFT_104941 [Serpula lacrymans var. lacrymans S7.3]|uniref:Cytochrome P450 n=2 Tax=Serpula lacrymans var. lacrymans TaxID=341189 RepID=F8PRN2_SERL3|nr:uncharacterized protein SERLADRAFT_360587 [Serpula lacrymans var. lacrymans S7.9]EGO00602.1 hypothetical protein SERLA73DRAFT_104941 [Serpula lacrymans var. lacrymans S7.3]EGO26156.1 hypothetical protein SERLADRAFT_360587 [Serpula lacrymans var. lacrymans S7.9]
MTLLAIASLGVLAVLYTVYRRFTRISIRHIRGPRSESFFLGNLKEFYQSQAGIAEFKWEEEFGDVVRIKAAFREDKLLVSDPKALQYVYQTCGYNFPKTPERRELSRLVAGRGLTWADGDIHKRQRKVMLPGFGMPETKALVPIFSRCAEQLTTQWKDILDDEKSGEKVFNVSAWMARATLDALGLGAFDYNFGAMDNADNELKRAYSNLLADLFGSPTALGIFAQNTSHWLPMWLVQSITDYLPSAALDRSRKNSDVAASVAKELIQSKSSELLLGKGGRDVMSLLVKANASENENTKLSEAEMVAQMRTLMLAGHDTTANTMSWALFELSKQPDIQVKLRNEIREKESYVHSRGDGDFKLADLDGMPYLLAVIKEVLRFHPVVANTYRQAGRDDVLPLAKPIITETGEAITEIPISKGTRIITSIAGYNRNRDLWGADADRFNPERWFNERDHSKKAGSVGVYGNLLTFAGGIRSCIGWRFALIEIQTFLIEMVGNFEFALAVDPGKIRRENCIIMVPTIEGEMEKGVQMPLKVSVAPRD